MSAGPPLACRPVDPELQARGREGGFDDAARSAGDRGRAEAVPIAPFRPHEPGQPVLKVRLGSGSREPVQPHPERSVQLVEDRHLPTPERRGKGVARGAAAKQQARRGGHPFPGQGVSKRNGHLSDGLCRGIEVHQSVPVRGRQLARRAVSVEIEVFGTLLPACHGIGAPVGGCIETRQYLGIAELVAEVVLQDGEATRHEGSRVRRATRPRIAIFDDTFVGPVISDHEVVTRSGDATI